MKTISHMEFRRRVFNHAMLECFSRILENCCEFDQSDCHDQRLATVAKKMSDAFYTDKLSLDKCTINQTKQKLSESVTFIHDCMNICEAIADTKYEIAGQEDMDIPEDQKIELSEEDKALLDKVFEEKKPTVQLDQIRDATVKALLEEDRKSQEIRDSLSIAQSQVSAGGDPKVMEETVSRLGNRGPTSLMNAIMNSVAADAVRDVNENAKAPVSVGSVMSENADEIKKRATMIYMMYESANTFGIVKYTPADIKRLSEEIYYNK